MALKVVEEKCCLKEGKIIVVIEGANPEEVLSSRGKLLAQEKAANCGYPRAGLNGSSGSYPVDANGDTHDDWNKLAREKAIAGYRNDIYLLQGL